MANKLRLKGHVKLTLSDAKTGRVNRVIEKDNVITDAVKDLLRYNLLGMVDSSKIFGDEGLWKKWFGGVMCYNQSHSNLTASDYYMETNPVIAHAGMTPIDTDHDDDLTRGQALASSFIRTADSIKLVWQWGSTQGNGIIKALSLVHTDVGSFGNGVDSYHFRNTFTPWELIKNSDLQNVSQLPRAKGNAFAQYDDYHTLFFFMGEDGWYNADADVPDGEDMINEVTVYVRRLPYTKAGLFDITSGTDVATDTRKFTVETSIGFKYNPAWYFDPETKYLWLFNNFTYATRESYQSPHTAAREWSRNTVWYTVIDCENEEEVDHGTIVSDENDLAFLECSADGSLGSRMYYGARVIHQNIMVDGDYVYLPIGESVTVPGQGYSTTQNFKGFKKINLTDQSDQETIPFCDYDGDTPTVLDKYYAAIKTGDLAAGFGWVMFDGMLYPCNKGVFATQPQGGDVWDNIYMNENNGPVIFATRRQMDEREGYYMMPRYIFANKLMNCSKVNITAVEKTPSQNMLVEYTITEQTGS